MVVVPGVIPVAIPDVVSIVAIIMLLLVHVPPAAVLLRAVVDPWHTELVPVIAGGNEFTVTTSHVLHPLVAV
jgi:hypothetical protein